MVTLVNAVQVNLPEQHRCSLSGTKPTTGALSIMQRQLHHAILAALMVTCTAEVWAQSPTESVLPLGEVIVTATRRSETVLEVPYNIQAISEETLTKIGATDLRDFMRMIPGLSFEEGGPRDGTTQLVLRGLTGDYGSRATTAVYIDDTQVDNVRSKLLDVERFEVLRGPQGTLYGGGAIGGILRYITRKPQLDAVEGRVGGKLSSTKDGGTNHELSGMINLPLVPGQLAVRAAAGVFDNDGYIDNIRLGIGNANTDRTVSSRIALLYAPSEALQVTATYDRERFKYGASSTVPEVLGRRYIDDYFAEGSRGDRDISTLALNVDLGFATLVSSTSYTQYDLEDLSDETYYIRRSFANPDMLALNIWDVYNTHISQEVRLVSERGEKWDYIVGGYWSRSKNRRGFAGITPIPFPGQAQLEANQGILINDVNRASFESTSSLRQWALFGELGYHFTEQLRASVGARFFDYSLQGSSYYVNQYSPAHRTPDGFGLSTPLPSEFSGGTAQTDDSVFRFNASYEFANRNLIYLTVAEGFRPGGFNTDPNAPANKMQYEPDSIVSYDLGGKLGFAAGRAYLSAALYYIDWSDMQTVKFGLNDNNAFYFIYTNAGRAKSRGVELELGTRDLLLSGLSMTATLAHTDMELKEDVEELGLKGDHAPLVPRYTGSLLLDYSWTLSNGLTAGFNVNTSYTGSSYNSFGPRVPSGGVIYDQSYDKKMFYWMTGASARLAGQTWVARLFAANLFNEDPDISIGTAQVGGGGYGIFGPTRAVDRPLTVGIDVSYMFGK